MKANLIILIIITFYSCQLSSEKNNIQQMIQEWQGKEIQLPSGTIEYKIMGRDTSCFELWNKPFKIFTFIDSVGCTSCRLGLPQWKEVIESSIGQLLNVSFIFIINSSDYEMLEHFVIAHDFNYPLIYDYQNEFDRLNHFAQIPYRTFLLDKDNKVLLIGSPIDNPKMWELYLKVISR